MNLLCSTIEVPGEHWQNHLLIGFSNTPNGLRVKSLNEIACSPSFAIIFPHSNSILFSNQAPRCNELAVLDNRSSWGALAESSFDWLFEHPQWPSSQVS